MLEAIAIRNTEGELGKQIQKVTYLTKCKTNKQTNIYIYYSRIRQRFRGKKIDLQLKLKE